MISKILWTVIFAFFIIEPTSAEKLGPIFRLGNGSAPAIAYNSKAKNFFVVWSGSAPYYGRLRGTLINLNGTRSPVRNYSSPPASNILFDPRTQRFLLIWVENNENVFIRFIDSSGNLSPINRIYNNEIGFGVFGIAAARQNLTGQYLINAKSAYLFILDEDGSILRKSGTIRLNSEKIFSSQKGSGYLAFGSSGGNLVFQTLDSQGKVLGDSRIILRNGTWWPLAFLTANFNPQNNQYLFLYLGQPNLTIQSVRVNTSGKALAPAHEIDTNLIAQPQLVSRNSAYRAFFSGVKLGLYTRKLDFKGVPEGSEFVVFSPQNQSELVSKIAVASTLDTKRHLICWSAEISKTVSCRLLYE